MNELGKMRTVRKAVLTGGAGLIGSTLAEYLLANNANLEELVMFDNFTRGGSRENIVAASQDPRMRVIEGDIRDTDALNKAIAGADTLFHLAAIRITRCAEEPRLANEILVDGAFNVFEAAVNNNVEKVVFSSSASVYGLAEDFPTTERHHAWNNDTIYGAAKAYGEGILRSFKAQHGLDYLALRYFNVYGPRMDTVGVYTEVFIRWMQAIAEGRAPEIHGDGSATMDFVYVGDIARANYLAATSDATDTVLNIATGVETSLLALCETLIRVIGSDLEPVFVESRKTGGVTRRKADISAARETIGFTPSVELEDGLRQLYSWWTEKAQVPVG